MFLNSLYIFLEAIIWESQTTNFNVAHLQIVFFLQATHSRGK